MLQYARNLINYQPKVLNHRKALIILGTPQTPAPVAKIICFVRAVLFLLCGAVANRRVKEKNWTNFIKNFIYVIGNLNRSNKDK